jgi:hypothetical protein
MEVVAVVSPTAENTPLLCPQKNEKNIRDAEVISPQPTEPAHEGQNKDKTEINKSKNANLRCSNHALAKSDEHTLKKMTKMVEIRNLGAPNTDYNDEEREKRLQMTLNHISGDINEKSQE